MDYNIIFKIAIIGILTAVVNQILKNIGKDEIATIATLAGVIVCLLMAINMITELFDAIKQLFMLY